MLRDKTIERMISASAAGIKMKRIGEEAGVKWWKIHALVSKSDINVSLSDDDCRNINDALDRVKGAL